jgi:hypothetical protein
MGGLLHSASEEITPSSWHALVILLRRCVDDCLGVVCAHVRPENKRIVCLILNNRVSGAELTHIYLWLIIAVSIVHARNILIRTNLLGLLGDIVLILGASTHHKIEWVPSLIFALFFFNLFLLHLNLWLTDRSGGVLCGTGLL